MNYKELWKLTEYSGYLVSNTGKVMRQSTKRILKQQTTRGYKTVALSVNGKVTRVSVHRLVASAFLDNVDNLPEVNHKNKERSDNHVGNLEWCDRTWNNQHAFGCTLVIDGVSYNSYREAHRATGIAVSTIRRRVAQGIYKS